ncbi:MAG: T9SS type A sorting domain-containing protein [Bacteroidales bacterium]|nr:T9SS type A sorting domain-containing protein [Bacteroidales bacterium]
MEQRIPFFEMKERVNAKRRNVKVALAAMLLTVLGVGNVQAQCDDIEPSAFSFIVINHTSASFEAEWEYTGGGEYWQNKIVIDLTNTNTGQTLQYTTTSMYFTQSGVPEGSYNCTVRSICTTSDTSAILHQESIEIIQPCTFSVSDFTVNASDASDDMPYDDMVTLYYSGSEALDSIHFIITKTTTGWTDSTNVTYDVDESRWYVQFSYLTAGNYTISLRPYCGGQARTLITNGNTWSFPIECTPENASPVIDDIDFEPVCNETTTVTLTVSSTCGSADNYEYYLDDPDWNGDPDNYDGTYYDVTPGEHTFTVVNVNNSSTADTTINVSEGITCEATITGSSEIICNGFDAEDYSGSNNGFYYIIQFPTISGDFDWAEAQYCLAGTRGWDEDWDYGDFSQTDGDTPIIYIPITSKGDWVVRLRTHCCNNNATSDWLLTDTIHHYPDFTVQSSTGVCSGNDGYATVIFRHPFNKSSSNIGVRIFPVDDPSDITFTQTGVSGSMIDLQNLAAGEYKMYVYVTDGTDENTYNAYLDTTFTIGTRVQLTIENDNARVCENTTDTLRANVSGGTQPYTYQWYYDGDYPDLGDGSNTLAIPNGPSNYVTCIVTDNNNCQAETYIEWEVLPAYTQETQNDYDDYSYDEPADPFKVPQNLCPLTRFGVTYDCGTDTTMDVNLQSMDGCDSIKQIQFVADPTIGIPGGGTLDTTIWSEITLTDDGGGSGYYSINSQSTAIVRAAGGERDKLIVYVYGGGALSDEDTLRIYKGMDITEFYNREGTWSLPTTDTKFIISGGLMTVHFYTGSKRGFIDDYLGYWKGHRMEQVTIWVKSPDQLAVTPICGGSGSVQVTNPSGGGVYYCLTKPGGTTDTIFCGSLDDEVIFSNLTDPGSYTLHSYIKNNGTYESTNHDTTFTVPAGSFELSVEGDSTTVCSVNPSVTLTASVTGGEAPYAYSWSDGSTDASITVSEAYTSPSVTVTDNSGCSITYATNLSWIDYVESEEAEEASVCESATTYTWNTKTLTIDDEHLDDGYYVYYDTVESAGTCPTIAELHLTVKPNATIEEHVVAWGSSYTWPADGNSYTTNLGGYSDTVDGCPVTIAYDNEAATATHSGAAANGCDSIYTLNLTLIDGIPIPATGTTDTTLATMVEGDTVWVYDESGMMGNYSLEQNGMLVLRAPEGYTLQVVAKEINVGDGDKVNLFATENDAHYYTYDYFDNNGGMSHYDYFYNNGTPSGRPYVSVSRNLYMKFAISDSVVGQGFKLAVTLKSLDDTCLAVYEAEEEWPWTDLYEKTITWRHEGSVEGYHVEIGRTDGEVYFDTIVTDTFITVNHEWISTANTNFYFDCWAICGAGDTSEVYGMSIGDQCGIRPGLAEDAFYETPSMLDFSSVATGDGIYNMPSCWNRIEYTVDGKTYPYIVKYTEDDEDYYALDFCAQGGQDHYAVMPKIDTTYGSIDKWALAFTVNNKDVLGSGNCSAGHCNNFIIGVMTDPTNTNTFTPVDTLDIYGYIDDAQYIVPLRDYHGTGLYPAFKYWANGGLMPDLLVSDLMVMYDMHIEEPTNLRVSEHPSESNKAVVSWDCDDMDDSLPDDGFENFYVKITSSDGTGDLGEETYDKSYTFNTNPGVSYTIRVSHRKPSARYGTTLEQTGFATAEYLAPMFEHQTVDTTADLNETAYVSNTMPLSYGNSRSNIMLFKPEEVDVTTIDGIAFRTAPNCSADGFQNVEIYVKDVDITAIDVTDNGGSYAIEDATPYTFTPDQIWTNAYFSPKGDGWWTIQFDSTFTHDPDKSLMIAVNSWAGDATYGYEGYAKFYLETYAPGPNTTSGNALSMEGEVLTNIPQTFAENPLYTRPQMLFISNKNCTNDTLVVDTNLCENASLDWRGMTISFSDPDIEDHKVQIATNTYVYVYTDKVEEVTASGCDSIYKLQITKRYNEDNNYDIEDYTYPHETSCGPYTWRNGVTYDYSMGTYQYDDGGCPAYGFYGPRAMDTVRGVATYGCDSIYGLNLTVDPWYTVVFDTTGVDAGTGMKPEYKCEGSDYTLPACTMTMAYKRFVGWEIDGEWYDADDTYEYDYIEGDTLYITPKFECDVDAVTTSYEELCPTGGEYEWRGKTITMEYAIQHGQLGNIDQIDFIEVYDTVAGAVGGVCDSIYKLNLRMENKLDWDEMEACEATGLTWIDGNHYDSDFGWEWIDDDDDGYRAFDMSTAVRFVDSSANDGCGKLHMLSLMITDESDEEDTIYFIRYYREGATELDTLHSMTMYVCDGYNYFAPECPDTVTREGYDFVHWTDNPACGWTVEPGEEKTADSRKIYLYGMWESNCEDKERYDTTLICSNDTVVWNGFTWNGPELEFGEWDTTMTKVGVIPGECDSIFYLHVNVPSVPMINVTGQEDPLCYGEQNGWISVAVEDGNAPYQYALGDSNYTAALDTTGYKFENLAAGGHMVWVKDACGVTDNIEVSINNWEALTVNVTSYTDSAVCYEAGKQLNAEVSGGTGIYTYIWNNDTNRTNDTLMVNTSIAGTRTDTILVTDENGCTATGSYTTLVYDTINVTVNGGDTTYCFGATAVPVTVTVTGGDTNSGYTYTWYDYNQQSYQGESITVPTNAAATYSQMGVTVSNSCGTKQLTVPTITVLDSFYVGPVSEINSSYCFGANATQIEVPVNGGGAFSGQWYMNGEAVTDHDTNDAANKYTPRTDTAGTFNYSLKIASNAGCGSDSVTVGTIKVYEPFAINVFAHDTNYCYGVQADTIAISLTGFDEEGNSLVSWYAINGTDTTSVNNETMSNTYVPPTTTAGTTRYIVIADGGCGVDTAEVATITVRNALEVNVEEQSNIYCLNSDADTLTLEGQINGNGSYAYQWYAVTGSNNEIIDTLAGATNIWYVPATNEPGDVEYRVKVTDLTCGIDTTVSVGSIYTSDSIRITSSIDSLFACPGSGASVGNFNVTYEGDGEIDYCWYLNGEEVYRDMVNEFMPSQDTSGVYNYYLVLRSGYGCASDSVVAGVLTVYDRMVVTVANQDTNYCLGQQADTLRIGSITGGSGNYGYYWLENGSIIDEAFTNNYFDYVSTSDINTGSTYSVNIADIAGCFDTTVTVATIIVNDTGTVEFDYSESTFCLNSNDYSEIFLNVGGQFTGDDDRTFQWYENGTAIAGADSNKYTLPTTRPGTYNYTVKITGFGGCLNDSVLIATSTVHDAMAVTVTNQDSTYCYGANADTLRITSVTGGSGEYNYTWYKDGEEWDWGETLVPSTTESGTIVYSVKVSDANCYIDDTTTIDTTVVVASITMADNYIAYFTTGNDSLQSVNTPMDSIAVCSIDPSLVLPENEYVYDMHEFAGWYNQSTGDTVQPGDTLQMTENLTFNTVWRTLCSNVDTVSYAEMCDGDTITWRGYTVTSTQTEYFDTIAGVVDVLCDSVYHLLLTVNYPTTSDTTILACDSIWWNNMFFTETPDTTQSYFMARANQYGCDSTAYLNLTVNYSIHDYVVETACDSYVFDSVTYTESTDLPTIGDIAENGCPFITHISLTVNYSYHGEDSATACDLYVWNDMELEEGGDHDYVGYTSDGCDSVVTLHLTMHYTAYGMDTQTACDSLVWIDGNTYFSDFPGDVAEITYLFQGASMYGCDSVAVLDLTMEDHIYVEFISDFGEGTMDEMSSCIGKSFTIPQCAYENEGFVFNGWVNQVVHDTVMPGDTVFLEESTSFIAAWTPLCEDVLAFTDTALCEGSTFVWRGHDYTDELYSGDYEDVAYAVIENYCDSIYYLRLTVYPVSYNEFYDSVVGSVIWYDEEYTTTGDYSRFCGYNRYGCDSTEVLHLIVNLSIDDKDGMIDVKVYPNPTQGIVNLEGVEIRRIAVLDQVGRTVATFDDTNRIDISDLPAGIYTLYLQTSAGDTTRRVVKR